MNSTDRLVLGIEAATPTGGAALASIDGTFGITLIGHHGSRSRTGFSRRLMPIIQELLEEAKVDKSRIAAIGVTHGPGSFTGVRVGMTTAKTLAHALAVPLYTFSTLECVALRGRTGNAGNAGQGRPICVALDARRKEIYTAVYRVDADGETAPIRDDRVESPQAFLGFIETELEGPVEFAGDWPLESRDLIEERLGSNAILRPEDSACPGADSVALAAARRLAQGREGVPPFEALPRYIRASDATRHIAASQAKSRP